MRIFFVRHGQSESNLKKVMAGHKDVLLTDKGREQALETAKKLKDYDIDIMFVSPLKRARETAEIINSIRENKIPMIIKEELTEVNYGIYEDVKKTNFDYNGFWDYSDKNNINNFFLFVWPIIRFLYGEVMHNYNNKNVLMVSSGGVSKIFEMILGEYSLLPEKVGSYLPANSEIIEYNDNNSEYTVYYSNEKSTKQKRSFNRRMFEIITPNILGKENELIKRDLDTELIDLSINNNPKIRNRLGVIVVNDDNKIAIRKYKNTNEVKLIGGDINYPAGLRKSIEHLVYDHSGFLCDYKNYKKLGNTIEIRPGDPLADITITEVVVVKLLKQVGEPDPPEKEIGEGFSLCWLTKEEAYEQIKESFKDVHPCKELEGTQHWRPLLTKQSIVYRDRLIMKYYIDHIDKFKFN